MPIGTGIIYNVGDLILSQVSGSGTSFLETKIAAATSSIVYFDNTARINSASLNSITVGTASYVSGSRSIITNLTASNISASGTGSFGMVGIGTTAPGALLDVNGLFRFQQDIRVNNGTDKLILSATSTTTELHSAGTTGIVFKNSGNSDMVRFDAATGNVGIGTTSPATRLHVYSAGGGFEFGVGSSNCYIETIDRASVSKDLNTGYYTRGTGSFTWNNAAYTERMRIDGSGSVLIGVNGAYNSSRLLQVKDGLLIGNSFYTFASIDTNGTADLILSSNANPANLGSNSNIIFKLGTSAGAGPDEKMRIVSNGNVGIGTTSPTGSLQVNKASQTLGATTPSGATIISNLAGHNGILELGVDTTNLAYIQSRNITDPTYYKLLLNPSGGSVGIGTSSPVTKLDVVGLNGSFPTGSGTIQSTGSIVRLRNGDSNLVLDIGGNGGNGNWLQATNRSDLSLTYPLLLNPNGGNVGIGITSPSYNLSISGSAGLQGNEEYLYFHSNYSVGNNARGKIRVVGAGGGSGYGGDLRFSTRKPTNVWNEDALTIDSSGNVGIGTSSPAVNLEVVGASETLGTIRISGGKVNVLAEGEINSALEFAQRDASVAGLVSGKIASISEFSNGAYAGLGFYTAQQSRVPELKEAVRIKYDGNVGIGTTVPAYLLDVSGSSRHGYQTTDTHQFTGSVSVSGSVTAASFTGSLSGSITSALTASYLTPANSYTITNLTASNISASLTGSFGIVGIGTTSFVYSTANRGVVEIYGSNDGLLALRNSTGNLYIQKTTTDVYINNESNGFIAISNNGSERWRITNAGILQSNDAQTIQTSTGNLTLATGGGDGNILLSPNGIGKVGIGTTIPAAIVDIQGTNITIYGGSNTGSLGTMYLSGNDVYNSGTAGAGIYFRGKFDAAGTTRTTFGAISAIKENNTDGAFDGALTFFARSGSNAGIIPERMRINSNGNVGIGTTNPVAKLQVAGNISGSSFTSSISNAVGFLGTSSWAQNVVSASFATTAQTANALNTGNSYTVGSLTSTTQIGGTTGTIQSLVTPGIYSNGLSTGNAIAITSNTTFANQGAWANLGLHQTTANANDLTAKVYLAVGGWYQNSGAGLPVYIGGGYTSNSSSVLSVVPVDTAGNGNVGIGTAAPAAKLEITGSSNSVLLNIKSPISGAILYVSGSGAVGIGTSNVGAYTLQVNGSFAATTKSFVIEHPTKAGKKLIYGSLESPYHGIRLTGRDTLKEGKCKIQLPDYIYKLILHDSVNIQLTGIKCNKTLYIDDINVPENYFTIAYDKAIFESYKDYDFFWDFTAIRADVPELQTEM